MRLGFMRLRLVLVAGRHAGVRSRFRVAGFTLVVLSVAGLRAVRFGVVRFDVIGRCAARGSFLMRTGCGRRMRLMPGGCTGFWPRGRRRMASMLFRSRMAGCVRFVLRPCVALVGLRPGDRGVVRMAAIRFRVGGVIGARSADMLLLE